MKKHQQGHQHERVTVRAQDLPLERSETLAPGMAAEDHDEPDDHSDGQNHVSEERVAEQVEQMETHLQDAGLKAFQSHRYLVRVAPKHQWYDPRSQGYGGNSPRQYQEDGATEPPPVVSLSPDYDRAHDAYAEEHVGKPAHKRRGGEPQVVEPRRSLLGADEANELPCEQHRDTGE